MINIFAIKAVFEIYVYDNILVIKLLYFLQEAVYNQTVNIVEVSEGLDGETFFLYVFLGAAMVLALVAGQQALSSLARRRAPRAAPKPLETGTPNDVDYDWLPKEVVNQLSKYFKTRLNIFIRTLLI